MARENLLHATAFVFLGLGLCTSCCELYGFFCKENAKMQKCKYYIVTIFS